MKLYLRDLNLAVVTAWRKAFEDLPEVDITQGPIFDSPPTDAIISPGNSFGFMDGGIDAVLENRFNVQEKLQRIISDELPVGQAVIINTQDWKYPFLIAAPTMRVPADVSNTVNAYLAFRAALICAKDAGARSLTCPGLCTGAGNMDPLVAAKQMRFAYMLVIRGEVPKYESLMKAILVDELMRE